jgi:hypothetical protein
MAFSSTPTAASLLATPKPIAFAYFDRQSSFSQGSRIAILVLCTMTRTLTLLSCLWTLSATASEFEAIGLDQLRLMVPSLTGSGVNVAQPEAGAPGWQVNPAAVNQPQSLFSWIGFDGSASVFPNLIGGESGHANEVAKPFYGLTNGIAPGVAHVDSYEADYFYNVLVRTQIVIAARVVNQSFIFGEEVDFADKDYDDYAARYGTIFVSGAGNGGPVSSPATAYNGIAVGAYGGASSMGPTAGGRSKPDITAPASLTSFSTPLVAGAATLLVQAANRNDAGPGTATAAADVRTIKALLLNSATKSADWTNGATAPLDARYGAGVVHVGNAYRQLRGGQHAPMVTESIPLSSPHPPAITSSNLPTRRGWDFRSLSSTVNRHEVAHYFVDLSSVTGRTATITLVWNRQLNEMNINNLELFLYDATSGALVASSESAVDNVEHIRVDNLPAGRYNFQVLKHGGAGRVSANETYGLAFEFGPPAAPTLFAQMVSDSFRVTAYGEPMQLYAVDATLDLSTWGSLLTNKTSALGSFEFVEPFPLQNRVFRLREVW